MQGPDKENAGLPRPLCIQSRRIEFPCRLIVSEIICSIGVSRFQLRAFGRRVVQI